MGRRCGWRAVLAVLVGIALVAPVAVPAGAQDVLLEPDPELDTKTELSPRVVGGTKAPAGAWPSQVGLLHRSNTRTTSRPSSAAAPSSPDRGC